MFSTFPSVCVFMHLGGGIPSWLVIDFYFSPSFLTSVKLGCNVCVTVCDCMI